MAKLDHLAIVVGNYRASRDWYVQHLGLKVEFEIPERKTAALQDDSGLTLFVSESEERPAARSCTLYFQVASVTATHRELTARGVRFVHEPRKEYWGYGTELLDPDGYAIRLWDEASMRQG